MFGRTVIGTVRCIDGGESGARSVAWMIRKGESYRVLRHFMEEESGTLWLTVLGDDGKAGNYTARRFDLAGGEWATPRVVQPKAP